uniref:Uncharacterized protein n=1 Tax=viral metagenome TaxID=1070528 RepID=A0A6M3IZ88_9ZZZZ
MSKSKDTNLKDYINRTQAGDVENSRDYKGTRKASINKKPWLTDNLLEMELLEWPPFIPRIPDPPKYPLPGWKIPVPSPFIPINVPNIDFRYYWSDCMFSASCPHVLGPVTSVSNNGCYELFYEYRLFWAEGIIKDISVDGPAKIVTTSPDIVLFIYPNASYGTKIKLKVSTISDTASQDARLLAEVNRILGTHVTEAELRTSRGEYEITYYLNKGCSTTTLIQCEAVCECQLIAPTIYTDGGGTVASGGSTNLWVDSGGFACPPYTWQVSGLGYSLSKATTDNDLETNVLSLAGGTCGVNYGAVGTVTVTDKCGETYVVKIRATGTDANAPSWVQVEYIVATTPTSRCSNYGTCLWTPSSVETVISGSGKWNIAHAGQCLRSGTTVWNGGSYPPPCGQPMACGGEVTTCDTGGYPCTCYCSNYVYYTWVCT